MMKKPVGLPKMFLVQIKVRCDCDAAEMLTESIMMQWDTEPEHAAYLIARAIEAAKAEAADHLVKRKNAA